MKDCTYNYRIIPYECRSNSALENYNRYLKYNLGKKQSLLDEFYKFYSPRIR